MCHFVKKTAGLRVWQCHLQMAVDTAFFEEGISLWEMHSICLSRPSSWKYTIKLCGDEVVLHTSACSLNPSAHKSVLLLQVLQFRRT